MLKDAGCFYTPAWLERRAEEWFLSVEGRFEVIWEMENGTKYIADVCLEFGLVNSTIQKICKNRTKIISGFEQKGSRVKRFRTPGGRDDDEALLNLLEPELFFSILAHPVHKI